MCSGFTCNKKEGEQNIAALRTCIKEHALEAQVHTIKTLCTGQCESGPVMFIYPDGVWYKEIDVRRAEGIITSHILHNQLLDNILYKEGDTAMQPLEVMADKTEI